MLSHTGQAANLCPVEERIIGFTKMRLLYARVCSQNTIFCSHDYALRVEFRIVAHTLIVTFTVF